MIKKMDLTISIYVNSLSILVLLTLGAHSFRGAEAKSTQNKLYNSILLSTIILLILDVFGRMDGSPDTLYYDLNHLSNYLLFILNPVLPSLWYAFINYEIYRDKKRLNCLTIPLIAINVVNVVLVVISQFNGWFYYIDLNNVYHRGPFFLLSTIIVVVLLIFASVLCIQKRDRINQKQLFSLLFFPIPPLIGLILQACIYGLPFSLNCTVLSLVLVLLDMKENTIFTDHLTGICNRKKIDSVLAESIKKSSQNRTFSYVVLDIDKFKEINDTFGHDMGDKALIEAAAILKRCIRSKDYAGRYGGDEFCLVLDVYDSRGLQTVIRRIESAVDSFNASGRYPFKLSFAEGHAVYDYSLGFKPEEFVKQVDMLMYENKLQKHIR